MMDMDEACRTHAANIETARAAEPAALGEIRAAVENAIRTGRIDPINSAVEALMRAPAASSAQ
jgi:hypothetical protein